MTDICAISKKLCELRCGMSPALTQNPSLSLLSSDTGTSPAHLIYKTCRLGLLPDWFPTSPASSSVFLPARHVKTVLFSGIFNADVTHWVTGLSTSSSMGCGGITGLVPCGLLLHGNSKHLRGLQGMWCISRWNHACSVGPMCAASFSTAVECSRSLHTKRSLAKTSRFIAPAG